MNKKKFQGFFFFASLTEDKRFNGKVKIYIIKELQATIEISMYQDCYQLIFYNDVFGEVGYYMEKDYKQGGGHEQVEGLLVSSLKKKKKRVKS